jgi:hypothetical protein
LVKVSREAPEKKKAFRAVHAKGFSFPAGDARLERATFGSGDRRSIQLS